LILQETTFATTGEYIELIKLLKAIGMAEHGAAAKQMVSDGIVYLNNQKESRFRAKLRKDDVITVYDQKITIQ
jgi:ribosome-associated protein